MQLLEKKKVYYNKKLRTVSWHNLYQGAGPNFLQKTQRQL